MELPGLKGKVAVVTGAGGGIGEAYAHGLAACGTRVVIADINKDGAERVAREIGPAALAIEVDVASPESTRAMAERAAAHFGGIDFLVNNAALFGGMKVAAYMDVDWDYYTRFMNINVHGALLCARACVPHLKRRGGGAIVNQSSTAAWMGAGMYSLAKLGINGLTQGLARELGPQKIRVNAIAPGPTETGALHSVVPEAFIKPMVAGLPIARIGTPQDHVPALLFLLSDAASWITGQVVNVDGGQISRP
jgi:3-oxoacyl-[acyl-carrier protein] reductase